MNRPLLVEGTLHHSYRLRDDLKTYRADWPALDDADRKILLRAGDVLTYDAASDSYTKHAKLFYPGIVLDHELVEKYAGGAAMSYVMGSEISEYSERLISKLGMTEAVKRTAKRKRNFGDAI